MFNRPFTPYQQLVDSKNCPLLFILYVLLNKKGNEHMKLFKKAKKGFTLIELVVVIAVIAILSAVSVVAYVGITNNAKKSVAEQEASKMKTMLRAELTRGDFLWTHPGDDAESTDDDATYVFTLKSDSEKDVIKYTLPAANGSDEKLELAIEALVIDAQGFTDEADCNYLYCKRDGDAYADPTEDAKKFVLKIKGEELNLRHPNGKEVLVMEIKQA